MRSRLSRARAATWTAFLLTGAVSATWGARVPAVQERLDLTPGGLALAVLGIEGGALLGLPLGAVVVSRYGTRTGLRIGVVVYAPGLLVAAVSPALSWLVLTLGAWAAANSVLDVALNAQGVELERRYRRPMLSGLHAAQSTGLFCGALGATIATAGQVSLLHHFGVMAALSLVTGLLAAVPLLPSRSTGPVLALPGRPLLLVGAIAFCAFLVDGVANSWIAVHLRTEHGTTPALAAAGYLVFTAALALGRLLADFFTRRHGRSAVVRICGSGAVVAGTAVVLAPTAAATLLGWALLGLVLAPLAPTVLGAAPQVDAAPAPVALAGVSTLGYLGSFFGAPLVGALAETWSLSTALLLLPLAGATAAMLARRLPSSA